MLEDFPFPHGDRIEGWCWTSSHERTFRGFVGENVRLVALLDVLEKTNDNDGIKFILALRDLFAILNRDLVWYKCR